jgi:hypothetical protein
MNKLKNVFKAYFMRSVMKTSWTKGVIKTKVLISNKKKMHQASKKDVK